ILIISNSSNSSRPGHHQPDLLPTFKELTVSSRPFRAHRGCDIILSLPIFMRFQVLLNSFTWKPIRGCPGRYVLNTRGALLTPSELISGTHEVTVHSPAAARDQVFIAKIEDGGLISYGRTDGTFVHTLNTAEGFQRKLAGLGIVLSDEHIPTEDESVANLGSGHLR
ncbi:MAG: hypothetical protein ACREDR_09475, partial [Blastocatellia bacterium]